MNINYRIGAFLGLVMLVMVGCTATVPVLAESVVLQETTGVNNTVEVLTFDVAEDHTRFVSAPDIVHEKGYPAHGSPFITQGYIYPAGTLENSDGLNADGSPEFPNKVLGTWTCRGWILGDVMSGDGNPVAISTQVFQLGEEYGSQTIISDGYEFMQPGRSWMRAIVGGSGEYRGVQGEQTQKVLRINEDMGMSHRFELHLEW